MNTLLTEVIVLMTIGWLATLYAWRQDWQRRRSHQQAWQWWHHKQTTRSHRTAESIRDGLLQQTFAFRRYLETIGEVSNLSNNDAESSSPAVTQTDQWLTRFQSFHKSLETLSDKLSPPFVADSLPHALQFTLQSWHTAQQLSSVHIELPESWPQTQSTLQQNRIVLSVVNTLLSVLLSPNHKSSYISVSLRCEGLLNTLIVKVEYDHQSKLQNIGLQRQTELKYLKEIFNSLTAGQLEISHKTLSIDSCFSWQNNELAS
ncbi:MAG: hypothetical protein AAFY72_05225 [Cyanobacteria bacterium J06649_4]